MPLYEMTPTAFRPLNQSSFQDLKVRERGDLQRLLRSQIEVLGDDLYVLSEEFGDWEDSRCIRLKPYLDGEKHLIDVQQIIPLPEANDYQVQLREKGQASRKQRAERYEIRQKFWEGLISIARKFQTRHANIKPGAHGWIGASSGIRGLNFNYAILQDCGQVELYIDRGETTENKRIFESLKAYKDEIENTFGTQLSWEPLDSKRACRIKSMIERGGYRNPDTEWHEIQTEMVQAMIKLEKSLKPALDKLKV